MSASLATTPDPLPPVRRRAHDGHADVEIVLPVHNEQAALEASVRRLHGYLSATFPFSWQITIVDNASADGTPHVARRLTYELPEVGAMHLREKGRGRALRAAWLASGAEVVAYMDVDLSTDLAALLPLVAPLMSRHSDVAIGTRLHPAASVTRSAKRELISRAYNRLLRLALRASFSDAQCGFKAIRADAAAQLIPLVADQEWFFDTELLVLAQRRGLRIHEVPVDWVEDLDSRVEIVPTALADLRGVARLLVHRPPNDPAALASPKDPPALPSPNGSPALPSPNGSPALPSPKDPPALPSRNGSPALHSSSRPMLAP